METKPAATVTHEVLENQFQPSVFAIPLEMRGTTLSAEVCIDTQAMVDLFTQKLAEATLEDSHLVDDPRTFLVTRCSIIPPPDHLQISVKSRAIDHFLSRRGLSIITPASDPEGPLALSIDTNSIKDFLEYEQNPNRDFIGAVVHSYVSEGLRSMLELTAFEYLATSDRDYLHGLSRSLSSLEKSAKRQVLQVAAVIALLQLDGIVGTVSLAYFMTKYARQTHRLHKYLQDIPRLDDVGYQRLRRSVYVDIR